MNLTQVSLMLEVKEPSAVAPSPVPSSSTSTTTQAASAAASNPSSKSAEEVAGLKRKYIRCSSLATVTHLKKFIAKKLLSSVDRYKVRKCSCMIDGSGSGW